MKKNPAIKEDNKARQFASVQKVVINNTSSGTSLWVPEDIAETDELSVTENGVYCAYDDNVFGYSQVVVNVPESLNDRSEKEKAISKITGTNPDTGDTESYGVDENGNLTKDVLPSGLPQAIHIVIAPTKKTYNEGESLDFTGIHVYLLDGEGHQWTSDEYPTGEIPFNELIFPVTTVDGSGQQGDGESVSYEGVNATLISFYDPRTMNENLRKGYASSFITGSQDGNNYCYIAIESGLSALITRYNGIVYTKSNVEEHSFNAYFGYLYEEESSYDFIVSNRNITFTNGGFYGTFAEDERTVNIPESTVDPTTVDVPIVIKKGLDIPVQWIRSDGETLEDKFHITISSGGSSSGSSSSGGEHSGGDF